MNYIVDDILNVLRLNESDKSMPSSKFSALVKTFKINPFEQLSNKN